MAKRIKLIMFNDITFNEIEMLEVFENTIKNAFKDDTEHNWYELFGNREIRFYDSVQEDEPQFPCVVIQLYPSINKKTINSSQVEQYTYVEFRIECYNQAVGELSKRILGLMINYEIKKALQSKLQVQITQNDEILSPDSTIYRRIMRGDFIFDNKNKIIYIGD